jgi:hypothetical protein
VGLLSDALGNEAAVGRFRDLVRVFENGFGLGASQMGKKLAQFLDGAGQGFTRAEIEEWLSLRDLVSHGDRQVSFPHESWVRKLLPRMEEAALDVLLNKATWGNSSRMRRDVWRPPARSLTNEGKKLEGAAGGDWGLRVMMFDAFGVYPLAVSASVECLPDEWWTKAANGSGAK